MAKRLGWTLALLVVLCGLVVGAMYFFSTPESRTQILRVEIAKIFLQLMVITVLGAYITWSFNEYNRSRDRASTLNEFRKETLRRLIHVTNQVRKVPELIEVNQPTRAYGVQMRMLVDAKHRLSDIRHEIDTSSEVFSEWPKIRGNIHIMESSLEGLADKFRSKRHELSRTQSSTLEAVSHAMQNLPEPEDLMKGKEASKDYSMYLANYDTARDLMRGEIWAAAGVKSMQTSESDVA